MVDPISHLTIPLSLCGSGVKLFLFPKFLKLFQSSFEHSCLQLTFPFRTSTHPFSSMAQMYRKWLLRTFQTFHLNLLPYFKLNFWSERPTYSQWNLGHLSWGLHKVLALDFSLSSRSANNYPTFPPILKTHCINCLGSLILGTVNTTLADSPFPSLITYTLEIYEKTKEVQKGTRDGTINLDSGHFGGLTGHFGGPTRHLGRPFGTLEGLLGALGSFLVDRLNVIFDNLEPPAFRKCSKCWVF